MTKVREADYSANDSCTFMCSNKVHTVQFVSILDKVSTNVSSDK